MEVQGDQQVLGFNQGNGWTGASPLTGGERLWAWVGFKGQEPSLEGEGRWAGLERPAEALPVEGQRWPS